MMSERKGSTSDKNKGGKPQQKAAEDQREPPDVPESPIQVTSKAAAITAASSSTQGEGTRDSAHSQQTLNGREEADGGESSQASGKRKLSKKEKKEEDKVKKEKEKLDKRKEKERNEREKKERKDREEKERQERKKEEAARQQQARSASQSKRKKTSQSTPPPLSPNEAHPPQRRHTHSEGSQASQVFTNTQDSILEERMKKVSESSDLQGEEDGNLTDMEKIQLLQKVAAAEKDAKHVREALQKMSNENKTLRAKLDTMNKQVQRLEEWHGLLVDNTKQASSSEATAHASQEKVIVDHEKHVQLKRSFIYLTERYMKIEKTHQELLEKIEERDKQIKELQMKVRDDSVVPKVRVYESLSSGEGAESVEELSHDIALREIKKQKAVIFQLRNRVASLQAQTNAFEKTAAEHSKMEQHGKEQSKAVMEWRQKFEVAENKLKEQEDELQILKGEVSAKRGQPKDSIDVQQMEVDYEGRIEALNTAMNTLEVDKAELTAKCATKELECEQLEQENQTLQQTLKELDGKHSQLKCLYDSVTQQLSQLNEYRGEVDAMKKQAAVIHKAITAKTVEAKDLKEEKESLQKILEDIADELESRKIQNIQAQLQYQKAVNHLEDQLQWVNNEVLKFASQVCKEMDLKPFIPAGMNASPATLKNIGRGAYGSVDLVQINGIQCAAKTIYNALIGGAEQEYVSSSQRKPLQEKFRQECILICQMRHPNIVQFMGVYCNDKQSLNIVLFMEYLPIDLDKCLEVSKGKNHIIPIPMKISILIDICKGLSYIHEFLILHRDLTAKNVLLTHHVRAKISDFGNSKLCDWSQKLSKAPGTIAYMPPEAKSESPTYNTALDVFSFGVLTLFVAIQEFPALPMNSYIDIPRDVRDRGEEELFIRHKWVSKLNEHYPLRPIIYHCLQKDPSKRPTIKQLQAEYLESLYHRLSAEVKARAHTEMLTFFNQILS